MNFDSNVKIKDIIQEGNVNKCVTNIEIVLVSGIVMTIVIHGLALKMEGLEKTDVLLNVKISG
jgi:hypothetical protein